MNKRRLEKLLRVGEDVLARDLPIGFGAEGFDCGTYACWGGYYCRQTRGGKQMKNLSVLAEHFGISMMDSYRLLGSSYTVGSPWDADEPGPEAKTELARRLGVLRSMLGSQKDESVEGMGKRAASDTLKPSAGRRTEPGVGANETADDVRKPTPSASTLSPRRNKT